MRPVPVAEIFGPTIQGEGTLQGVSCHFVRFGGCDFACEWCDTPHAVLPQYVRQLRRMTTEEIIESLDSLDASPEWVVLTGGNPALHDLSGLVRTLHRSGRKVMVETQGSKNKEWLWEADSLCLSPKPPSSGMRMPWETFGEIYKMSREWNKTEPNHSYIKVVVFNPIDYEWAVHLRELHPDLPFFVSAGNDAGRTVGDPDRMDLRTLDDVRRDLLDNLMWLTTLVMNDSRMNGVRVQAQQHVLLWGNELGR